MTEEQIDAVATGLKYCSRILRNTQIKPKHCPDWSQVNDLTTTQMLEYAYGDIINALSWLDMIEYDKQSRDS